MFRGVCVGAGRAKEQVKLFLQPLGHRIKAAGAEHLEIPSVAGAQTDVMNKFVGPAMLGEEVGAAAHRA